MFTFLLSEFTGRVVVATKSLPQLWCEGWGMGTPLLAHAAKNCGFRIRGCWNTTRTLVTGRNQGKKSV